MQFKGWALTMGLGAAAGAVAILMMPRQNPTRRLADKAADKVESTAAKAVDKVECAACKAADKLTQELGM